MYGSNEIRDKTHLSDASQGGAEFSELRSPYGFNETSELVHDNELARFTRLFLVRPFHENYRPFLSKRRR